MMNSDSQPCFPLASLPFPRISASPVRGRRRGLGRVGGFTLLEVLAAMAIFFMAIGILVSATSQALRLAEIERSEAVASRGAAMRLGWFRDTLAQTRVPADDVQKPFKGTTRQMSGSTGLSLTNPYGGPSKFSWELSFNAGSAETELRVTGGGEQRFGKSFEGGPGEVVMSWPGSAGQFRYLDEEGRWQDQWPPFGLNPGKPGLPGYNLLPVAVMLEYGADRQVLVAAIQNRSLPPPSLKEMMK